MSEAQDRVQMALEAHLEHAEFGGPAPDTSHLSEAERDELARLIGLLDETQGIAFGRGLSSEGSEATASTEPGERLLATLRDALPAGARVADDPAATTIGVPGMEVVEGWVVGTFGGRVRVWLLGDRSALGAGDAWLRDLERAFRALPDTAAIAIVEGDLSCLLVQPEDCAPAIEVPRGSIVGRRYRRPIVPLAEALPAFIHELMPHWEEMQDLAEHERRPIDVPPIARDQAARAIEEQAASGRRARTEPKRSMLSELGDEEAGRLAELLLDVHEGRADADDVEEGLRRLAARR